MRAESDDDLFRDSTMSFGEHLEELRGALFRSLIGVILGFLIGLLMAKSVVRWIEVPLQKGLRNHYLTLAVDDLSAGEHGAAGIDQWEALTEQHLVPRNVMVDANGLLRELHQLMPERFPGSPQDELAFTEACLSEAGAQALLQAWHAKASSRRESFAKILWQQLPTEARNELTRLAEQTTGSQQLRSVLLRQLNWLVVHLDSTLAIEHLSQLFHDASRHDFFQGQLNSRRRAPADQPIHDAGLNRQLISAAFNDALRLPPPATVELTIWEPIDVDVQALSVHEPFVIFVKAAILVGLLLSSPWVFFQIWHFVAAGLYPHERHLVYKFMPISLGLFLAGAGLAFFFVFEPVLDFLFGFNRMLNIHAQPRITDWMSFVLILPLGFGISFQLPLVMVLLERIGVFTVENYQRNWRIAVLVIFVLAMLLTPADPVSMLLMAIPLTGLYFGGIALCRRLKNPHRSPVGAGYDP